MYVSHRPSIKKHLFDDQIQPWSSDQNQMNTLIFENANYNHPQCLALRQNSYFRQNPQLETNKVKSNRIAHFNFFQNLRKYQTCKFEENLGKKQINFIEKNKKQLSEDFQFLRTQKQSLMISKLLQENKSKKHRHQQYEYKGNMEPIALSMIMYYDDQYSKAKKNKHKDIQSFLRFQSQKIEREERRRSLRFQQREYPFSDQTFQPSNQNNFQKLLKLKQGIRRRNLKSASQSRKNISNSLQEKEQHQGKVKQTFAEKNIPKTSHQNRINRQKQICNNSKKTIKKNQPHIIEKSLEPKPIKSTPRVLYTSYKNRAGRIMNVEGNKLTVK